MQSFESFSLNPKIFQAITELGYTAPTPIQAQTLPILLGEPTDFLGLAGTGTGKTAAFVIPLLEKIDFSSREVQALILCPTRELALQVTDQINQLGKHMGVKALTIYGGSSYQVQFRGLDRRPHIVVGTPGRVVDHLERKSLDLSSIKFLILDEADEMISMGFKEDLEMIMGQAPKDQSNIWLFSATMEKDVRRVADAFLKNPQQVQVNKTEMLSTNVEQLYYVTKDSNKPEILAKLIDSIDDFYGLIFCQTKATVADLTQYLIDKGYRVDSLHGDRDQNSRERTMRAFRDRKVKILVCTDVASRGLDVKDITHVINYSLPRELELYVHRIGRTARSGKSGVAMSLVTPMQRMLLERIERMTKTRMTLGQIPSRKSIGAKKVERLLPKFLGQKNYVRAMEVLGEEWRTQISAMTQEEVAGRLLSILLPDVFGELDWEVKPHPFQAQRERAAKAEAESGEFQDVAPERDQRPRRRDRGDYRDRSEGRPRRFTDTRPDFKADTSELSSFDEGQQPSDVESPYKSERRKEGRFTPRHERMSGPRSDRRGPREERRGPREEYRGPRDENRGPGGEYRGARKRSFSSPIENESFGGSRPFRRNRATEEGGLDAAPFKERKSFGARKPFGERKKSFLGGKPGKFKGSRFAGRDSDPR